jgi:peroxiredoxin
VLAISPDRPEKLKLVEEKAKGKYTLLSDAKLEAALALGLAFKVDEDTVDMYKKYGIDLEEASGESHGLLPVPAVYVLDKKGKILFEYINPEYQMRIAPEVVLAAAKAFK